jgi:hypothetical protein
MESNKQQLYYIKIEGYEVKKTIAILFAALLAIVPLSAQATAERPTISISSYEEWLKAGVDNGWVVNSQIVQRNVEQPKPTVEPVITEEVKRVPEKALVIVDAYFDSSKISGEVVNVCIAKTGCELTPSPIAGTSSAFNHGTAMAELARKANPDVKIYLVRAASSVRNARTGAVTMQVVNGNDFLNALKFVQANKEEVGAVSFSYSMNGNMTSPGECRLSTSGSVNVSLVDPQIRSAVSDLKASGIPVFAATGNDGNRKPVSYPACITEVNSVASGFGDRILSSSNHDSNTDYVGALPANTLSYTSTLFGTISHATSSATASVAAMWLDGLVTEKWVRISR